MAGLKLRQERHVYSPARFQPLLRRLGRTALHPASDENRNQAAPNGGGSLFERRFYNHAAPDGATAGEVGFGDGPAWASYFSHRWQSAENSEQLLSRFAPNGDGKRCEKANSYQYLVE